MTRTLLALAVLGTVVSAQAPGIAYLAIDLRTGSTMASARPEILDRPTLPGSVIKIATLAAALESGVINDRTGIACTREVTVAGHHLTCTHPDLGRPLNAAEALAHSCNVFFATAAARVPRSALDRALADLGLPLTSSSVPVVAAALGVDGIRVAPRALIGAVARVAAEPSTLSWKPTTLAVIRDGLRGAAEYGTASALKKAGISALAKTGTTVSPQTGAQGLVVGVTPATKPTTGFVLLAAGAAGSDAAALAAARLAPAPAPQTAPASASSTPVSNTSGQTIRVGIARPAGGYDIRVMPLDDYVAGVLAGEAARASGPAALEALAITVRTFVLANPGRHRADGFDLCDLTHCQVLRKATTATTRAAMETSGRILLYQGAPASVFYTASCGGHTERPSQVWPGASDPVYLPSREDDGCEGEPAWTADLAAADLARALRSGGFKGDTLRDVSIVERNSSGRVTRLKVSGFTPDIISGQDLRVVVGRTLGWQYVKNTAFEVRRTAAGYHFSGHGSGHGVGMCVIGSAKLAVRGQSAQQILARYFPGANIGPIPAAAASLSAAAPVAPAAPTIGPARPAGGAAAALPSSDLLLSLPAGDDGERSVIFDLAVRARDSLAKDLGVAVPTRLSLRFHPTVESYQRATGQPWYTAGATLNTDIHFVPLTVLRDRGVLDRTIRHELVHVLTEPALANRPLWVKEGAASYFAGERTVPGEASHPEREPLSRVKCPEDAELLHPASPGALSNAYARATACFARQISAGRKWTEIK